MPEPDLSEFLKLSRPEKKKTCLVGAALDALPEDERAALVAALQTDAVTPSAIAKWLAARELKANLSAVSHHRRGTCVCHG